MRLRINEYEIIKAMFVKDTDQSYKILGLEPQATVDEKKNHIVFKQKSTIPTESRLKMKHF